LFGRRRAKKSAIVGAAVMAGLFVLIDDFPCAPP
jgi:hypothetical protein